MGSSGGRAALRQTADGSRGSGAPIVPSGEPDGSLSVLTHPSDGQQWRLREFCASSAERMLTHCDRELLARDTSPRPVAGIASAEAVERRGSALATRACWTLRGVAGLTGDASARETAAERLNASGAIVQRIGVGAPPVVGTAHPASPTIGELVQIRAPVPRAAVGRPPGARNPAGARALVVGAPVRSR
jgi:hypothetical protein